MDLYDVMTTTFASRDFTDEPLPDDTLFRILDRARFAPSGGNRQAWRVIVVRDTKTREGLSRAAEPAAKRYVAQERVGEVPWNTIERTQVDTATIERTLAPPSATEPVLKAAVVLVVAVDLKLVASMDADLDRVGIVSGASVYPFPWNILLAARHEGFAGALTTLAAAQEPAVQVLLGLPPHVALAAVIPLGRPSRCSPGSSVSQWRSSRCWKSGAGRRSDRRDQQVTDTDTESNPHDQLDRATPPLTEGAEGHDRSDRREERSTMVDDMDGDESGESRSHRRL